jgi:hypothetical protein
MQNKKKEGHVLNKTRYDLVPHCSQEQYASTPTCSLKYSRVQLVGMKWSKVPVMKRHVQYLREVKRL